MTKLEIEIKETYIELQRLKVGIFNLREKINDKKYLVDSRMMYYLTKTQYDYMNWYCEVLEKRLKLMRTQQQKEKQSRLPS